MCVGVKVRAQERETEKAACPSSPGCPPAFLPPTLGLEGGTHRAGGLPGTLQGQERKGNKPLGRRVAGRRPGASSLAPLPQPLPCPRACLGNGGTENAEVRKQGRKEPLSSAPGSGSGTGAQKCCQGGCPASMMPSRPRSWVTEAMALVQSGSAQLTVLGGDGGGPQLQRLPCTFPGLLFRLLERDHRQNLRGGFGGSSWCC